MLFQFKRGDVVRRKTTALEETIYDSLVRNPVGIHDIEHLKARQKCAIDKVVLFIDEEWAVLDSSYTIKVSDLQRDGDAN